jgi:polyisoprenoid-binding protein YceI
MAEATNTKMIEDCGKRFFQAARCLLILSPPAFPQSSSWSLDPNHTHVEFQIRRVPVSNVRGSFGGIVGTLVWNEKYPSESQVDLAIPTANISTNNASRDANLKSANFFEVQKYQTMTFALLR